MYDKLYEDKSNIAEGTYSGSARYKAAAAHAEDLGKKAHEHTASMKGGGNTVDDHINAGMKHWFAGTAHLDAAKRTRNPAIKKMHEKKADEHYKIGNKHDAHVPADYNDDDSAGDRSAD